VPHTLLLADDSVTIQRVIELTFADEDIHVIAVSDGDQAIARIESSPPDIILADIGMPGKNGYEVAQYVKQSPRLAHIPVVLLTGAFEPVDQARAEAAGCEGVLAKPFEPQLVIGRVKELLGKSRVSRSSPDGLAPPLAPPPPLPPALDDDWAPPRADQMSAISTEPSSVGVDDLNNYFDRLDAAFANMGTSAPPTVAPAAAPAAPSADDLDWFGTVHAPEAAAEPEPESWDLAEPAPAAPVADLALSYASPLPDLEHLPTMPQAGAAASEHDAAESDFYAFEPAPVEAASVLDPVEAADFRGFDAEPVAESTTLDSHTAVATIFETSPVASASAFEPAHFAAPPAHVAAPPAAHPVQSTAPAATSLPPLADAFAALLAAEQGPGSSIAASEWLASASAPAAPEITDDILETITQRVLERLSDRVVRETVSELVSEIAERLIREEIERIRAAIQ
jgi:CheY-like chemotaxis protein